ncbi:MAG: hypothetical protein ACI8XO_003575 [Verrucomicrobiales bacterium]|jgi:hypothetical protein
MAPKKIDPKPVLERARKPRPEADEKALPEERVKVGDYLLLDCPSCGREVKLNSAFIGHRMGCGYCKAPLEIIEKPGEEESKQDLKKKKKSEPLPRRPLSFRKLRDEDIADESEIGFADEFERRRLPFESPLWDDEEKVEAGAPKKRLLTHREAVFRNITYIIMAASLTVVAVILYSALVRTMGVAKKDDKTLKALPDTVKVKIDAAVNREVPISVFLESVEEEAAAAIIDGFLSAQTIEDRLPYVRDPERVRPLMKKWYARDGVVTDWPDGEVVLRDKLIDKGRYFVRLAINFPGIGHRIFAVEQTKESFKLDWETATGYQPMPYEEFIAQRPKTPVEFRVKLKPSDYYNYQFSDKNVYRAVELSYPGHNEFKLIGYLELTQAWAKPLSNMLDSGMAPSLIVTLRYPDILPAGEDQYQVQIMSIASDSWWR